MKLCGAACSAGRYQDKTGQDNCKSCIWRYPVTSVEKSALGEVHPGTVRLTLLAPIAPGDLVGSGLCNQSFTGDGHGDAVVVRRTLAGPPPLAFMRASVSAA